MRDPVIASDGHTYERAAIAQWLRTGSDFFFVISMYNSYMPTRPFPSSPKMQKPRSRMLNTKKTFFISIISPYNIDIILKS